MVKHYICSAYFLGTDELTGKAKNTTRRGLKTKKEAELALARIKLQVSEGTYKQKRAETYQEVNDLWITQYEKTVEESTFVKTAGYFKNISYLLWAIILSKKSQSLFAKNTTMNGLQRFKRRIQLNPTQKKF